MDKNKEHMPPEEGFSFSEMGIPPIMADGEDIVSFNKLRGFYERRAERAVKPTACCLCGKPKTSFCNSHSIPEFCLRSIATHGHVLSTATAIGTNLVKKSLGVGQAGTFHLICNDCDNRVFKGYETDSSYDAVPTQRLMGQVALKICLYEMSKALKQEAMFSEVGADFANIHLNKKSEVRGIDARDDRRNYDLARRTVEHGYRAYKLIYYKVLNYTTPVAFQTMVNPLVDLQGNPINDLFTGDTCYAIEPLYACAFPMKDKTVLMLFKNRRARRYDRFIEQFDELAEDEKKQAILKLVLAYCEEVYFSPVIEHVLASDPGLAAITRMDIDDLAIFKLLSDGPNTSTTILDAASDVYSLDALPSIPYLLGAEYALTESDR